MVFIIILLVKALDIYLWLIIGSVLISWLIMFNVLNMRNRWVYKGVSLINRAVNPPMEQLRRVIPPVGNIDFTPMVLMFAIMWFRNFLWSLLG